MITIISKEQDKFSFDKDILVNRCQYFENAYKLQENDKILKTDIFEFYRFSSPTIKYLLEFIKTETIIQKIDKAEELIILSDYIGNNDLIHEYLRKKEIKLSLYFLEYLKVDIKWKCLDNKEFYNHEFSSPETLYIMEKNKYKVDELKINLINIFRRKFRPKSLFDSTEYSVLFEKWYKNYEDEDEKFYNIITAISAYASYCRPKVLLTDENLYNHILDNVKLNFN